MGRADTQPKVSAVFLLYVFYVGLMETEAGLGSMGCVVAWSFPAFLDCGEMPVSPRPGGQQGWTGAESRSTCFSLPAALLGLLAPSRLSICQTWYGFLGVLCDVKMFGDIDRLQSRALAQILRPLSAGLTGHEVVRHREPGKRLPTSQPLQSLEGQATAGRLLASLQENLFISSAQGGPRAPLCRQ